MHDTVQPLQESTNTKSAPSAAFASLISIVRFGANNRTTIGDANRQNTIKHEKYCVV